jgi:hypothetical protein
LHAELWRKEGTPEELWALVALTGRWRAPDSAIEQKVWARVATGRIATQDCVVVENPGPDYEFLSPLSLAAVPRLGHFALQHIR